MQFSFIDLLFTIDFMFAFNFKVSKLLLFIVCIKPSIENGKLIIIVTFDLFAMMRRLHHVIVYNVDLIQIFCNS